MINISKINKYYVLLFLLCFLDMDCMYLIDVDKVHFFGISYLDFEFLIHIVLISCAFIDMLYRQKIYLGKLTFVSVIPILLAFTSAYSATISYGQSFLAGFVSLREWMGCLLMIIPFHYWYNKRKVTLEGMKTVLFVVCAVYLFICILQYFTGDFFSFTYSSRSQRYGENRYAFEIAYPVMISGMALENILSHKNMSLKNKYLNYYILIGTIFLLAIVTKGRMATIAFVLAIVLCVLFSNLSLNKKIYFFLVIPILLILIMNSTMGEDIINTICGNSIENDTLSVRTAARSYYWNLITEDVRSVMLGVGTPNIHSVKAMSISNPLWHTYGEARFYLSDVGMVGEFYIFGILGVLWYINIMIYCTKKAICLYKEKRNISYLILIIADFIGCVNLVPMAFETSLVIPLFITMLADEVYGVENSRKI